MGKGGLSSLAWLPTRQESTPHKRRAHSAGNHVMISRFTPAIAIAVTACASLLSPAVRAADAPTKPSPDAQYVLGPDSKPQEGVPKGVVTKHVWEKSVNFPGTIHDYWR